MAIASIMCFGSKNEEDPETKKSREIEKQIRDDQKRMAKEVKVLLLGGCCTNAVRSRMSY